MSYKKRYFGGSTLGTSVKKQLINDLIRDAGVKSLIEFFIDVLPVRREYHIINEDVYIPNILENTEKTLKKDLFTYIDKKELEEFESDFLLQEELDDLREQILSEWVPRDQVENVLEFME